MRDCSVLAHEKDVPVLPAPPTASAYTASAGKKRSLGDSSSSVLGDATVEAAVDLKGGGGVQGDLKGNLEGVPKSVKDAPPDLTMDPVAAPVAGAGTTAAGAGAAGAAGAAGTAKGTRYCVDKCETLPGVDGDDTTERGGCEQACAFRVNRPADTDIQCEEMCAEAHSMHPPYHKLDGCNKGCTWAFEDVGAGVGAAAAVVAAGAGAGVGAGASRASDPSKVWVACTPELQSDITGMLRFEVREARGGG